MRAFPTALTLLAALYVAVPVSASDTRDDRKKAIELFKTSEDRYREGRFEDAAALLREAYALDPAPTLLYNLARALESAGDLNGAKDAYQRYLVADPGAKDRIAIERRIENLGRQIEERADLEARLREEQDRKAEPAPAPPPPAIRVVDTAPPPSASSPVPWIVVGVGGAVLASGIVLGVIAQGKHTDAIAAPIQEDAANLRDEASGLSTAANASFIAGGAVALVGLVWGVLTLGHDTSDEVTLAPLLGDRWAGVVLKY